MCWTGYKSSLKIADNDIKVYKAMYVTEPKDNSEKPRYYAPLTVFEYEIGKLYKINRLKTEPSYNFGKVKIDAGYHSFSLDCKHRKHVYGQGKFTYTAILNKYGGENFKFINNKPILMPVAGLKGHYNATVCAKLKLVLLECIIPKGARYYENEEGEIVSNKLILTENRIK